MGTVKTAGLADSLIKILDDVPMFAAIIARNRRKNSIQRDKTAEDLGSTALPSEINSVNKMLEKARKGNRASRKQMMDLVRTWGANKRVPDHMVGLDPMQYSDSDRQAILDIVSGKKQYAPAAQRLVTYDPKAPAPAGAPPVKNVAPGASVAQEAKAAAKPSKTVTIVTKSNLGKTIFKVLGAAALAGGLGYGAYKLLSSKKEGKK